MNARTFHIYFKCFVFFFWRGGGVLLKNLGLMMRYSVEMSSVMEVSLHLSPNDTKRKKTKQQTSILNKRYTVSQYYLDKIQSPII